VYWGLLEEKKQTLKTAFSKTDPGGSRK
jgi:hypothetical protein